MTRQLLASAAILAMLAGPALAQDQQTTTQEKTTVQGQDGSQSVKAKTTEHSMDSDGNVRVEGRKFEKTTDADGNESVAKKSYSKTSNEDGSEMKRTHEERTDAPAGATTHDRESVTTTTTHDHD